MERLTVPAKKLDDGRTVMPIIDGRAVREHAMELYWRLKEYEDLEEQGLLLKKEDAVDEGYLYDWYIHSVCDDEPVWTEAHIEELFNDFILIPKAEAEKALAEMEK